LQFRNYIFANFVRGFLTFYIVTVIVFIGMNAMRGARDMLGILPIVIPATVMWLVFLLWAELLAHMRIKAKQRPGSFLAKLFNRGALLVLCQLCALLLSILLSGTLTALSISFIEREQERLTFGNYFLLTLTYFSIFVILNVIYLKYKSVEFAKRNLKLDLYFALLLSIPTLVYVVLIWLSFFFRITRFF